VGDAMFLKGEGGLRVVTPIIMESIIGRGSGGGRGGGGGGGALLLALDCMSALIDWT